MTSILAAVTLSLRPRRRQLGLLAASVELGSLAAAGLLLLSLAGATPLTEPGSGPGGQPNIIVIMCDDLGYGDLGVLYQNGLPGTKKLLTPELDQFAAEGLILDRHYCPAPVCAPSRASLMSGVHQGHANVRDTQFDKALEDDRNLANVLQAAGYWTALIGKWGLQGGDQPLNDSTVDLSGGATLAFTNETVAAYLSEHLAKTTVDGAPAVVDANILVVSDGGSGCVVSALPAYLPYCLGDPGSDLPCPCGNDNDGSVPGSGCANGSFPAGARLTAQGDASASSDTLVLATSGLDPNQSGLYFQADNDLAPGLAFGDGLRCAGESLIRSGVRFADAGGSSDTSGFPLPISVKTGNIVVGGTKYYQCWYRNPNSSACLTGFNLSNGLAVTWWP